MTLCDKINEELSKDRNSKTNPVPTIDMSKTFTAYVPLKGGRFKQTTLKTAEAMKNYLLGSDVEMFVVKFNTMEKFAEKDKKTFRKKIEKALVGTEYKIQGDWKTRVEQGNVFDNQFEFEIKR
jgi:hypothetical protein